MSSPAPLLEITDLRIGFAAAHGGETTALRGVSLHVGSGERIALVGESGSGKSLLALACMGLLPPAAHLRAGRVLIHGREVEPAALRGRRLGLVFQEAGGALNPVYSVGFQLRETLHALRGLNGREAEKAAAELLDQVELEPAGAILRAYPHQLSGGQLQRVMIALALAGEPELLIADEPTTSLDLRTQAEIMALFRRLGKERGAALLLISHDLAVVADLVERVAVIYAGEIVEEAATEALFADALHPYTRMLLQSIPGRAAQECLPVAPIDHELPTSGCSFAPRCQDRESDCRSSHPSLQEVAPGRLLRCPVAQTRGSGP